MSDELEYGSKRRQKKVGQVEAKRDEVRKKRLMDIAGWIAATVGFVLISTVVGLMTKMTGDYAALKARVDIDEVRIENIAAQQNPVASYIQLSSAKNQRGLGPMEVEMELRDAVSNIIFDPRRSVTDITIENAGAYFAIAAPQVGHSPDIHLSKCFDLWQRVNDTDVNNSNVRICFPEADPRVTDVIVAQSVACYNEGDVVNLIFASTTEDTGLMAILPEAAPLIPAIIFSMFRIGDC